MTETQINTGYKYRWLVLTVVLIAEMMDLLDATITNVAGPTLAKQLGASATDLQWVIAGYALALGAGLILGGRLGDRFGRRTMFLFGLIGFTATSLLCALAPNVEYLIAFRLLQGLLGAMLLPQGFGLIKDAFPPQDFAKAFAAYGPAFGLGGILGPIIGGFLIEANLGGIGWRSVFLVNVPIGIAAVFLSWRYLPRNQDRQPLRIDLVGVILVMAASAFLVYPLIQGQQAGWPLWTYAMLVGSLVLFGLFWLLERRAHSTGKSQLIDATIFSKRAYSLGVLGLALYFAGSTGIYLVLSLFLQFGQQFSSAGAALGNIPIAVGSAIGATLSGAWLADKIGRRVLQLGATVQVIGVVMLWMALPANGASFSIWQLVAGLVVSGIGSGLIVAPIFDIVLSSVDGPQSGSASGVMSAIQSVSSSVGVAIFATAFFAKALPTAQLASDSSQGFKDALLIELIIVALFFVLSFALPKKAAH
jgi:EmrB/QacA subfamily drug resistance transporter